jgi:hypothetical protein
MLAATRRTIPLIPRDFPSRVTPFRQNSITKWMGY